MTSSVVAINGRCHVCKEQTGVIYCKLCGHWFCSACQTKWGQRIAGFIQHAFAPEPFCCGPYAMKGSHVTKDGIVLDELDYLRLVKARGDINAAILDGQRAVQQAEQRVQAAREAFVAKLNEAGKKYDFDPAISHRMDDDTCQLIPEAPAG